MEHDASRRDMLKAMGAGAVGAVGAGALTNAFAASGQPAAHPPTAHPPGAAGAGGTAGASSAAAQGPWNILFILTDQERMFRPGELPAGYRLPAHERLAKAGTVFDNHQINSCVCTPSRSVIYTGQHIQHTRMFDNTNFPWITSLATDIPTLGHVLRDAGYYTAYKGKWHLTKEFETVNSLESPEKLFTREMEAYGFGDYFGIGDIIAHTRGGYLHDGMISAMGVSWLRGQGRVLAAEHKPWFLAVNLVNPHDIMFLDTDRPGEPVQGRNILSRIEAAPDDSFYRRKWGSPLPKSYAQRLDEPSHPPAHAEFLRAHDTLVGRIPDEDARWHYRHDYYLNCLRDVDRNIAPLLDELEAQGLASNTIVVLTADHGDLDGAHRMHAKGATAYREQNNVPLIIAHPAHAGGKRCKAVTSHLDLAPTLLAFTGAAPDKRAAIARKLPGKDFSGLLAAPAAAGVDAARDGSLFCYNMFAYIDGAFMEKAVAMLAEPDGQAKLVAAARAGAMTPDMRKRGAIRSVVDGRYRFSRYFSPRQHNRPTSMESLLALNDVELYDLVADPLELHNLALDPRKNGELMLAMNAKLNALIDVEVGEDLGQMLPGGVDGGWVVTDAVYDM